MYGAKTGREWVENMPFCECTIWMSPLTDYHNIKIQLLTDNDKDCRHKDKDNASHCSK